LRDAVAGDPVTGMKWTHKSLRRLSKKLHRQGFHASPNTWTFAGFSELSTSNSQVKGR
jgi:DDE family transposase